MTEDTELWVRLRRSAELLKAPTTAEKKDYAPEDEEDKVRRTRRRRRIIRTLDIVSSVLWLYWITKLFFGDPDRAALDAIDDGAANVLDYRFFIYLGALVLGAILFKRRVVAYVGYVLAFPLIVFVWKIPAFFVKRRSWTLLLASTQSVFTFVSDLRFNVVTKGLALFAAMFIVATENSVLNALSAIYIAALMVYSLLRALRKTFSPSAFLTTQRKQIDRIVSADMLKQLTSYPEELKGQELDVYTQQQFSDVMVRISAGIAFNRLLYFWAYQLDRYRREFSPALIFNGVAYLWLVLGIWLGFTLVNLAVYDVAPDQFTVDSPPPSVIAIAAYSFASFFMQSAGGVMPSEDLAYGLQLASALIGSVLLLAFVLNVVVTARRQREETAMNDLVADLKSRAREHDKQFQVEFEVSVAEARQRMDDVAAGFAWLLGYISTSIPDEFVDEQTSP